MVEKPDMKKIKENFLNKLELQFNVEPSQASDKQIYQALSAIIVEELKNKFITSQWNSLWDVP